MRGNELRTMTETSTILFELRHYHGYYEAQTHTRQEVFLLSRCCGTQGPGTSCAVAVRRRSSRLRSSDAKFLDEIAGKHTLSDGDTMVARNNTIRLVESPSPPP